MASVEAAATAATAATAAATTTRRIGGAGILIHYKNWILAGLGGRFVSDKLREFINPATMSKFRSYNELSALQTYSGSVFEDAKVHFSDIAKKLSIANGRPIQYSKPVLIEGRYKTRFLFIDPSESKWGIPKGGAYEGETAKQTAIRETEEEIGIALDADRLMPLLSKDGTQLIKNKYAVFIATIESPKAIPALKKLTEDRAKDHYGELFNVGFAPIERMLTRSADINPVTVAAVNAFATQIGVPTPTPTPTPAAASPKTRRSKRTRKNESWRKRF